MANTTTTILQQLLHLLPRHDFQSFVGQHGADRYTKRLNCWNQLTIMLYAQVTEKDSLRDIETGLGLQGDRWYHLGLQTCARSPLSRANERRPYRIYESLFYKLLKRCQSLGSGTASFSFRNDLYALDSTSVDLCLSLFPWAAFRKTKGAIKLHTRFNVRSQIPELICVTDMFHLSSENIAGIYRKRWDIELFFKWIKQHLKIKTFLGTSKNAVLTQIWIAMIYYLLLWRIKHQTQFKGSLHTLTVMLREVALQMVRIIEILNLTPKTLSRALPRGGPQLALF